MTLLETSGPYVTKEPFFFIQNHTEFFIQSKSCYRVIIYNFTESPYDIQIGDRIAQIIFEKISTVELEQTEKIASNSTRGDKGFGSTGV